MKANTSHGGIYTQVISSIIRACNFETYLELGVGDGSCIRHIVSTCSTLITAVDLKPMQGYQKGIPPGRVQWVIGSTTNVFFESNDSKFDAIFIDADHSSQQVLLDFENSLQCLNSDGIIFLHDTYPPDETYLNPGL